jgi:hypothetical protein
LILVAWALGAVARIGQLHPALAADVPPAPFAILRPACCPSIRPRSRPA